MQMMILKKELISPINKEDTVYFSKLNQKNIMKKLMVMFSFILGLANLSQAQNYPQANMTAEDRANMQTSRISKALNLSDDQTKQAKVIFLAQAKSMDSLRSSANGDFASMRPAMKAIGDNTNAKLNAILTDDQKAAYEKIKAERMNRQRPPQN